MKRRGHRFRMRSSDVQHHIPDPVKVHPIGRRMYITTWHKLARCFLAPLLVVVCIITDQHGLIELLLLIALQVALWILPEVVSKMLGEKDILAEIRDMQLLPNLEERQKIDLRDLKTIDVRDCYWACWPTRITLKGAAGTKEIITSIHQPSFIKLLKSVKEALIYSHTCIQ